MVDILVNHADMSDPELHEAKGVSTATAGTVAFADGAGSTTHRSIVETDLDFTGATAGDVFTADGAGAGSMEVPVPAPGTVSQGVYNVGDVATIATPIPLSVADTYYVMTNDNTNPEAAVYPLPGLTSMWDVATSSFIWTEGAVLADGDTVDIRVDLIIITTAVNTVVDVTLELDVGGLAIDIPIVIEQNFKVAGSHQIIEFTSVFMGGQAILDGPSQIKVKADNATTSVTVRGWFLRPFHTNT